MLSRKGYITSINGCADLVAQCSEQTVRTSREDFRRSHRGLIRISSMTFTDEVTKAYLLLDDSSRSSTVLDRQVEEKKDG